MRRNIEETEAKVYLAFNEKVRTQLDAYAEGIPSKCFPVQSTTRKWKLAR